MLKRTFAFMGLMTFFIANLLSQTIDLRKELRPELGSEGSSRWRTRGSGSLNEAVEKAGGVNNIQLLPQTPDEKRRYVLSLLLPFSAGTTEAKIDASLNARETGVKPPLISDEALTALSFLDGVQFALKQMEDTLLEIELHVFDTWNNDSVTRELLKNNTIQYSNIIIGPATNSTAKLVADFCRLRKIVNIQPFSPSKSLTHHNPYHIKIAPTIDAHIDNIARSLADSFLRENVVIYCTNQEGSLQAAQRLDSLLKNFDAPGKTRFTSTLFNSSNPFVNGVKKSLADLMHPTKRNVVVVCVFDESNAQVVIKQLAERKSDVVIYGMPTWLNSEILRLDYLNKLSARFTEQYVFDTTSEQAHNFYYTFFHEHGAFPSRYAWLGYDLLKWLEKSLMRPGDFPFNIAGTFFNGAGNKFQFREVRSSASGTAQTDYFENSFLHLLRMENYVLQKEW